jgi:hypothetical protein
MDQLQDAPIVGAGGYGIVLKLPHKTRALKLLYDTSACTALRHEADAQGRAYEALRDTLPEVGVPAIIDYTESIMSYKSVPYLCGICMEYLPPPLDFDEAVHMVLGYDGSDMDSSWGARQSEPVSETNPTRGFFASSASLEWIWAQEGSAMTVDRAAYLMGRAFGCMLDNGILPIDLEWVWSNGRPWIIDFGLCEFAKKPVGRSEFLKLGGTRGLASDLYIPHEGQRGHDAFIRGFEAKK